jgi:serine protease inhibitor
MNTVDLKPWIQEATPSLFDPLLANLSNAGEGLFVQSLTQDARVDVFEQGFEAAAVTEADVGTTSFPSVPTVEIRLDRSFIFLITNQEGLLHFIGIVHQPFEA